LFATLRYTIAPYWHKVATSLLWESTEVGRIIREATAGSGKKLSLELGGKSPFAVFDDADLDGAVEGVVDAIWFNQGGGLLRRLAAAGPRRRRGGPLRPPAPESPGTQRT